MTVSNTPARRRPRDSSTTTADQNRAAQLYAGLTERNRGLITGPAQEGLARAVLLVAGCGSTGGAAVEPLARLGVQHFLLADLGRYELNNLNRQHAYLDEMGEAKAEVCARRIGRINPGATAEVFLEGITADNVDALVKRCDVVVDGVDVTEPQGWAAKYDLHWAAARAGRPVISGYDMAGTQYVRFYRYRAGDAPFSGAITRTDIEEADIWLS